MVLPPPQRQGAGGAADAGSLSSLQQPVTQATLIRAMEQNNAEQARRLETAISTMQTRLVELLQKWGVEGADMAVLMAVWQLTEEGGVCQFEGVQNLWGEE